MLTFWESDSGDKGAYAELDPTYQARYEILGIISYGKRGASIKCERKTNGMTVALRACLLETIDSYDDEEFHKLSKEVRTLSNLHHPNMVYLFDVFQGEVNKSFYFELEYYDKLSCLYQKIIGQKGKDNLFKEHEIVPVIRQISSAAKYLHDNGVVHGAIKSRNIFYKNKYEVVISDFMVPRFRFKYIQLSH